MDNDIVKYNSLQTKEERKICDRLMDAINGSLSNAEAKIWHGSPVWFIDGNPIVGYSKQKRGIQLLFWSGASFDDNLKPVGKYKAAEMCFTDASQISFDDLARWLRKSEGIQWDYKNLVKRRGLLEKNKIGGTIKMKESKTMDNLMEAFAGESQANRKYMAYSKVAEKDGKINAAKLFKAAADAETLHALKHFEVAGKIHSTVENLKDAVAGETHEYKEMYPGFVEQAEVEGNRAAVVSFTFAMKAEEVHARLYQEALENLDQTEEIFYYRCPVCGNIEKYIPEKCSICGTSGDKFVKY
jgi:rubrerythrin